MRSVIQRRLEATTVTGFALGALTKVLSREVVASALATHGKVAQRACKLPPELVTWLVVAMGLFRSLSICRFH